MPLSNDELKKVAGAKTESGLRKWLRENRIPFLYDANGKAITTELAINRVVLKEEVQEVGF